MKKLSQMFCNLLLMAVIDGLLIYTELGTAHPFQGDTKKILLIAIGDLIWILLVLWGDRVMPGIPAEYQKQRMEFY